MLAGYVRFRVILVCSTIKVTTAIVDRHGKRFCGDPWSSSWSSFSGILFSSRLRLAKKEQNEKDKYLIRKKDILLNKVTRYFNKEEI